MAKSVHVIVRASPEKGFFRAGRFWPPNDTEADVTPEQLVQLQAEKRLFVRVAEATAAAEAPKAEVKPDAPKADEGKAPALPKVKS